MKNLDKKLSATAENNQIEKQIKESITIEQFKKVGRQAPERTRFTDLSYYNNSIREFLIFDRFHGTSFDKLQEKDQKFILETEKECKKCLPNIVFFTKTYGKNTTHQTIKREELIK